MRGIFNGPLGGGPRGGGGSAGGGSINGDAQLFRTANASATGNTGIGTFSQLGDNITFNAIANTISNMPDTASFVDIPLVDIFGNTGKDIDLIDLFRSFLRAADLAPATDFHVGIALMNTAKTHGFAVRLASVSGDWKVQHNSAAGSGWGASWSDTTADPDTQAFEGQLMGQGNGNGQARIGGVALDATGVIQTASAHTIPASANIGNDFTVVRLFAGFIAGGLATVPMSVQFRAGYLAAKIIDFATVARLFL